MKLAINGQQLSGKYALPELLEVLAGFGVNAIEIWPANLIGGATPEEWDRYESKDVAGAAVLLRERGFQIACVTLGFFAAQVCFARGGAAAFTEAVCGAVDAASILGAEIVNVYSVGIPPPLFTSAIRPAAAYAAARGVIITLENEAHDDSGLPENIKQMMEEVASPGFGTQYDPCNYYHAGVEPYPAAYETVRKHIRYVHLKGGCRYDPAQHQVHQGSLMRESTHDFIGYLPLPEAAFPVEAIIRRMHQDGYTGWVTLEPHVPVEALLGYYKVEVPYIQELIAKP